METLALIGLGSNLGDRKALLDGAVAALRSTSGVRVVAVSRYHETQPVGGPTGQGPFLNAAVGLMTTLDVLKLLAVLQEIERVAGRVRIERWGERTLDLDLLMFDTRNIQTPELTLPHPRMAVRRFVLAPLAEIAPEIVDTFSGLSVRGLLENLDRRPSYVALYGPDDRLKDFLFDLLVAELGAVGLRSGAIPAPPHARGGSHQAFYGLIKSRAEILASLRSDAIEGDRWLLSDFCLSIELRTAPYFPVENSRDLRESDRLRRFREIEHRQVVIEEASTAVSRAPKPTFAVILGQENPHPARPFGTTFPLLWPGSDDPEEVAAEVLAACRASRGE